MSNFGLVVLGVAILVGVLLYIYFNDDGEEGEETDENEGESPEK